MGLRDAIDAGKSEIRTTAEQLIKAVKIEELIKQAVVLEKTTISVSLPKRKNMHVIQAEVVRQIEEEGFKVAWRKSCCPDADHAWTQNTVVCTTCKKEWSRENNAYTSSAGYGEIRISWDELNHNHSESDFNKGSL